MPDRFAVLDLGSNTFHLLIVEKTYNNSFKTLYKERRYTKLSEGGGSIISERSFQKAIKCLVDFKEILTQYSVNNYKAFGTATLRKASNGPLFIESVLQKTQLNIEIIDGNQEAQFIAHGVQWALKDFTKDYLIMDIGGGSVEFIQIINQKVVWVQSFAIGLGVLKNLFPHSEPIRPNEIVQIEQFLKTKLTALWKQLTLNPLSCLVGSSGSFEVLADAHKVKKRAKHYSQLDFGLFLHTYQEMIHLDSMQRAQHPAIPVERVDLIVLAFILMHKISFKMNAREIVISDFAMKEGIITQYF